MKKINFLIVMVALCSFVFTSCKKNSTSNTHSKYYIKFKVNDSLVAWTNVISELGADLLDTTKTDFTINGGNTDTSKAISLSVQVSGVLPAGTYPSDSSNVVVFADYYTGYNASSTNYSDYDIDDASGMSLSIFTITLTSITSNEIRGTFTGNYLTDTYSGNTVSITEGEFFTSRIPY